MYESIVEALAWQRDQLVSNDAPRGIALERGDLGALIDEFLQSAEDGMARDAGNQRYTRETVRALRGALSYADSELGTMDIQDIRRRHVQALINQLSSSGVAPARVVAVADSLAILYAYAIRRELVGFSPMVELELPASENGVPHTVATPGRVEEPPPGWTSGELWTAPPPVGDPWTPPPFDSHGHTNGDFSGKDAFGGQDGPTPPPFAPPPPGYTTPPQSGPPGPPPGYTTPPPYGPPPPGYTTPPPYGAPPPGYATPPSFAPPQPGYTTQGPAMPQPWPPPRGYESGPMSTMFRAPGAATDANYDATMQERWLWWTVRIIVLVFVLIALVLVAESV
jgi:hypothetical protein